jgi:hypothetical protein
LDEDISEAAGTMFDVQEDGQAVQIALVQPPESFGQQETLEWPGGRNFVPAPQTSRQ